MRKRTLFIIAGFLAFTLILLFSAFLLKGSAPSIAPPSPVSPTPALSPEEQKEKEAQENYAKDRAAFLEEKPWVLKLPLKSPSYFISYDPEQDEFLATVYFSSASETPIDQQLAQSKRDAIEAIRNLGIDPSVVHIIYFETEKK